MPFSGKTSAEVSQLKRKEEATEDLRLHPEAVMCPKFDESSIALHRVAKPDEMGFRVIDNCAEEHIM